MKNTKVIVSDKAKYIRKESRKAGNLIGFGSLIYTLAITIISFFGMFFLMSTQLGHFQNSSQADITRALMDHPLTGIISIVGSLIALLTVFLCFAKQGTHKQIFNNNKPMTPKKLGGLLCVLYLFSSIGTACYQLIEQELNLFGLSTSLELEMVSGKSATFWMFLYVSFIGPIAEELVFRGFLLRRMEKHGKLLAVAASSVLFGLMHENLPQVMNATMIGLVLGYIAMEYSMIWSIVLHVFNNFVVCDLMNRMLEGSSELVIYLVEHCFLWVTAIIAIVILVRNRRKILGWIRRSLCEKQIVVWTITSAGMVIAVVYYIISTINMISIG